MSVPIEHPDSPHTEREAALQMECHGLRIELAEAKAAIYVPGGWRCDKCGFDLTKSLLFAKSGAIGADLAMHTEPCPNDGEPMRRVTWEEDARKMTERLPALFADKRRLDWIEANGHRIHITCWKGTGAESNPWTIHDDMENPPWGEADTARETIDAAMEARP